MTFGGTIQRTPVKSVSCIKENDHEKIFVFDLHCTVDCDSDSMRNANPDPTDQCTNADPHLINKCANANPDSRQGYDKTWK
jgi:hypothetical protein